MSYQPVLAPAQARTGPLIILCDGTWCGRETNTKSNIYVLAKMVGVPIDNPTDTDEHWQDGRAWYIHGVGLGSTFLSYIFNGITGHDIAEQCVAAYRFIVYNYSPERELWMFGLSRGSFLVRSIAGMINNCGIVKHVMNPDGTVNTAETDLLCHQVYQIYRSRDPINEPHSAQSRAFRQHASWPLIGDEESGAPKLSPPVKFMGIIDTVGQLGVPEFVGGVGLDWPQFHDQNVSTVVELVYHAMSLHDRFYIFTPCLASRKPRDDRPDNFGITQKWFPGVHYDLGRQRFRFFRVSGVTWLEERLGSLSWANREIKPNEVLSDLVLKWILEAVRANDPQGDVIASLQVNDEINTVNHRMVSADRHAGDGDVYQNILSYGPFGKMIVGLLTMIWGKRWQMNQVYKIFFDLRDRSVEDLHAKVYNYKDGDPSILGAQGRTVEELAGLTEVRYPSQTYRVWRLLRRVTNISPGIASAVS